MPWGDITTEQLRDMIKKSGEIQNMEDLYIYYEVEHDIGHVLRMEAGLYHNIIAEAKEHNQSPVYICLTPVGIWRFNLEFFFPEEDATKVYLNTSKATPMLPWFPAWDSEEEWVAQQMIEYADEEPYADDLELLIEDMINSEIDFDNEYETNE